MDIYWIRWHLNPSPNCHLFIYLFPQGLMFLICGNGNSIFPSFRLPDSLHPSHPLPPCESASILLFRSPLVAWQMWQIWSYVEITPNRQRFFTWSIPDQVALSEPQIGPLSFFLCFFFFFFPPPCLAQLVLWDQAVRPSAKKHFISDPIISSA